MTGQLFAAVLSLAAVGADERVCGAPSPSSCAALRFIDVPTFWINVDSATGRAARMRAQLAAHLAVGVCATRVSAVRVDEVIEVAHGELLPLLLARRAPNVEDAIMLSHLKAIFLAARRVSGPFLILEDDVDFMPISHYHAVLPRANITNAAPLPPPPSVRALAAGAPRGWSLLQLMVVAGGDDWAALRARWKAAGAPPLVERASVVRRFSAPRRACEVASYSAGAYVLSARAAGSVLARWPTAVAPRARGGVRVRLDRSCFTPASRWPAACAVAVAAGGAAAAPEPELAFFSDHCIVNFEMRGPAISLGRFEKERRAPNRSAAVEELDALADSWRSYSATPPWFTDCNERARSGESAHGSAQWRLFLTSQVETYGWWRKACRLAKRSCTRAQRDALRALLPLESFGFVPKAGGPVPEALTRPERATLSPLMERVCSAAVRPASAHSCARTTMRLMQGVEAHALGQGP